MGLNVKISVIMCAYNHENYIATAIESILMQNCSVEFELLIGDDCSTDTTREIIREYAQKYPKIIKLIYPENNLGASLNLVNLIKHAEGDIISCCDGDDFWLRDDMLQKQINIFQLNPDIGMVCAKAKCYIQSSHKYQGTLGYAGVEDLMTMLTDNRDVAAPTIAFRTELMRKCIEDSMWYIEKNFFYDSLMAYWFAYHSKIKYIDEELAAYRVLTNSACHSSDNKRSRQFSKRYFMIKWHFVMSHPDICNTDMFEVLMNDYDERTNETEYHTILAMRQTKAYKLGSIFLKPLKKIFKK